MPEVHINYLLLFFAGIINMVIGFLWYSPSLFGNTWMKLSGVSKSEIEKGKKEMPKIMGLMFLGSLIMGFVLIHMNTYAEYFYSRSGTSVGLTTAFFSWLGCIMPVQLSAVFYERQPMKLFLIHTGYRLVALLAMGIIISL